jgi:hypothetical protein
MSRIGDILVEIEDRLAGGQTPQEVAKTLNIPLHWVTETEMDMEWTGFPACEFNGEQL